ncbi:MAG: hypothetical protein AAFQ07_06020 [Chloroflexota bacterium]
MLASVTKLDDQPIIIVRYQAPFRPQEDISAAQEQIAKLLDDHGQHNMFRIDDLSEAGMDWNSFVEGIFIATRDVPGSMTDTRINGVLVGEDALVKMASESMKQEQYGSTQTMMFDCMHQAMAYVQEQLA